MKEGYIEFSAIIADGKLDVVGIGMIYGVHANAVEYIEKDIESDDFADYLKLDQSPKDCIINGKLKNISYFEGQQTFPETCQWDIAPGWQYDVEITSAEAFPTD